MQIDPQQILKAFSDRKVLISMMDGPARPFDSNGEWYRELIVDGGVDRYLDTLVSSAGEFTHVIVEWRIWPEFIGPLRVYSRYTIRPHTLLIN